MVRRWNEDIFGGISRDNPIERTSVDNEDVDDQFLFGWMCEGRFTSCSDIPALLYT